MTYLVESEVILRAVDKPFNERQILASFPTSELAYKFIEKYLQDTKDLHTYFARQVIYPKDEYEQRMEDGQLIAINIVLGQFEDMIYIKKDE